MSEQQAVAAKQRATIQPFEVEVSTHNSGMWHSMVLNQTYRGRWSIHKQGTRTASISSRMSTMPDIPGIRIKLVPKDNKVISTDPLEGENRLLNSISSTYRGAMPGFGGTFTSVPRSEKVLDDDMFKTLLLELRDCTVRKTATLEVVSGAMPTVDQIESLPGRELNDMHSPLPHAKYKGDEDRTTLLLRAMEEKGIIL